MARYIDADKLYDDITISPYCTGGAVYDADDVINTIRRQPTADVVEVKHGEWLPQLLSGERVWCCSKCKTLGSPRWLWCPVCGAKMDGGEKEC